MFRRILRAGFGRGMVFALAAALTPMLLLAPRPSLARGTGARPDFLRSGLTAAAGVPVVAVPGYAVAVFAAGSSDRSHPDPIIVADQHIYVAYQNVSAKDGTDHKSSTIVAYRPDGTVDGTWSVMGHCDGLRQDPATGLLWATTNEDGNPGLYTINTATSAVTSYQFPAPPHGGGYDDLTFTQGRAFIAASNPTLDKNGVNTFAAIDAITLQNGTIALTPVLMGNASAVDATTKMTAPLNEVDPDSLTVDDQGNLVLVNQGGSEIVFLGQPGTAQQTVRRVAVGTQLDDTIWAPGGPGRLFVTDGKQNVIYTLRANFVAGTVYTAVPGDSGVAGFVGTVALDTGIVTPIATGFGSPTGLVFVPDSQFGSGVPTGPVPGMPTTGSPGAAGWSALFGLALAALLAGVSLRRAAAAR